MEKVNINGVDFELNMLDADTIERFENLTTETVNEIKDQSNYEGLSNADSMRFQCRTIERFFDDLFGAGTSGKVFPVSPGKQQNNDLGSHIEAFGIAMQLSKESKERVRQLTTKYGPERTMNREERRAAAKVGKNGGKNKVQNFRNQNAAHNRG